MTRSAITIALILGPTAILALMTLRAVRAGHVAAAVLWSGALAAWVLTMVTLGEAGAAALRQHWMGT